ncbi:sensor histidine kinase [Polaribacter sp. IC073]|uniref:sensor histidine kinase n=1 Tax=Polaribacter sp. IC073 TaxID=2508540 RepID=UPI0011BF2BF5|nr:ATP-binding protein [Polaribacter sp. IC073]TXD49168.1 two-component sensor histidine kinase [Polaribacter sp. IC073]
MNSLLKRQIRKFLPKELHSNKDLEKFLDAIDRSYTTSEEQFGMLQRATAISSEELFRANNRLKEESNSQKLVIDKLESVIDKIQSFNLLGDRPEENTDSLKLVDFIDNQTREIIKVNQQKDKLLKSLELQNQELNDYAHMVSHDLKSPLQSIEALISWIQEDYKNLLDASGNENLQLIRDNVEKMDTLVKGILEYATIRKIENKYYNVDLEKLVDTILKKLITTNNIKVVIPKKLPTIKGDNYRLEKLFYHILQNAIRYNEKEIAVVEIGFEEESKYWNFFVKDNGNGIEEKYFDKVFEAFQKLENENTSTGLGLSLVKKVIDVYKGKIWIESSPNLGTTFYFSLKK